MLGGKNAYIAKMGKKNEDVESYFKANKIPQIKTNPKILLGWRQYHILAIEWVW